MSTQARDGMSPLSASAGILPADYTPHSPAAAAFAAACSPSADKALPAVERSWWLFQKG